MGVMSHKHREGTTTTKPGKNQPRLCPATVTFDPGKTRELFHDSVRGRALSDMSHCAEVLHIHRADK